MSAFQALAETLHFSRAASQVNLSPSALSRLIARLEEELGTALFERDTRQVTLTTAGERFRKFAKDSLDRKTELALELEADTADTQMHGTLRIYASVTACYTILPPLMEELVRDHPALRLSVETGDPAGAADAIREGQADLAVSAIPEGGFNDLESYSVRKTPLVFAASRSGPWGQLNLPPDDLIEANRAKGEFSDTEKLSFAEAENHLAAILEQAPLILPRSGLARARFDRWIKSRQLLEKQRIQPLIAAETAGNEALLAMARLGMGLALVPRLVLENSPFASGLVLYQAGRSFGDYEIGYIQKKITSGSPQVKNRRALLEAIIRRTYP